LNEFDCLNEFSLEVFKKKVMRSFLKSHVFGISE